MLSVKVICEIISEQTGRKVSEKWVRDTMNSIGAVGIKTSSGTSYKGDAIEKIIAIAKQK